MIERGLIGSVAVGGDAFEGIPKHIVARANFVDGEVGLEHRLFLI